MSPGVGAIEWPHEASVFRQRNQAHLCILVNCDFGVIRLTLTFLVLTAGQLAAQTVPAVTLEQAIEEALAHNLDLAADRQSLGIAEARQITAGLKPNPILTLQGQTLALLGTHFIAASPAGPNHFNGHIDYV